MEFLPSEFSIKCFFYYSFKLHKCHFLNINRNLIVYTLHLKWIVADGDIHSNPSSIPSNRDLLPDRHGMVPRMHRALWPQRRGPQAETHDWVEKVISSRIV